MDFFEVCYVTPDMIRVTLREPAIVHMPIRAATVAETQSGGVFEPINIVSISNDAEAIFTLAKAVPWANDTYIRISGNAEGKTEVSTTGSVKNVSGSTFKLWIGNGTSTREYFNGAHSPNYVANSAFAVKLSTGTGSSRKYVVGQNLDKVKDADYFPGPRGSSAAALDLANYSLLGKTLTFVGLQKDVYDVGSTGLSYDTNDERYVGSFEYHIYIKANSVIADGAYTLTFPAGLSTSTINFTLNDKTTRCCSIGVNQIGYKPTDESKIGTLCQYIPQYTNYGSVNFLADYSITDYHLIDEAGTIVWSKGSAPVLRLGNQTAEKSTTLDSISADPICYGVDIASITPGAVSTIVTVQPHALTTGDKVSVLGARGIWLSGGDNFYYQNNLTATVTGPDTLTVPLDTTGATSYISGGKVTKFYSVNYAGVHTFELDFSTAVLPEGVYKLYIPNFGVSDPIYIDNAAWARVAAAGMKGLYHQAMGMAKDGRFGITQQASAKVGVGGVTRILYTPLSHVFWTEQAGGRLKAYPSPDRFISGTVNDLWGAYMDAGDWDRLPQMGHLAEMAQLMGPMALVPKASRYVNANFPASKDTIATSNYPRKFLCDWLDAVIWELEPFRRTQAVDGGIYSAIQFNAGLSNFPTRLGPQPTHETNTGWLVMAPDDSSTTQYAYVAAMLAWHLRELGETTLSNLYLASAELAYSYHQTILTQTHEADYHDDARLLYTEEPTTLVSANPLTFAVHPIGVPPLTSVDGKQWVASNMVGGFAVMNGVTYCLRQSGNNVVVYDSTNTTAVNATGYGAYTSDTGKFTPTQVAFRSMWDFRATALGYTPTTSIPDAAVAAGILYNLTGNTAYKTFHDANRNAVGYRGWGTYIYGLAPGATAGELTNLFTNANTTATSMMLTDNAINDRSFTYFRNSGGMQLYGGTTQPVSHSAGLAIMCHKKAYDDRRALGDTHEQAKANAGVMKWTKVLQDAYTFLLGANPLKMCWCIGHGVRSPCNTLYIDKQATGNGPPAGIYPYWITNTGSYNSNPNTYLYSETMLYQAGASTAGGIPNTDTELIPHVYARPRMVSFIPSPWLVEHTEFNLSKLYYLIGIALYLQHWEGSDVQYDGKSRVFVTTV